MFWKPMRPQVPWVILDELISNKIKENLIKNNKKNETNSNFFQILKQFLYFNEKNQISIFYKKFHNLNKKKENYDNFR